MYAVSYNYVYQYILYVLINRAFFIAIQNNGVVKIFAFLDTSKYFIVLTIIQHEPATLNQQLQHRQCHEYKTIFDFASYDLVAMNYVQTKKKNQIDAIYTSFRHL